MIFKHFQSLSLGACSLIVLSLGVSLATLSVDGVAHAATSQEAAEAFYDRQGEFSAPVGRILRKEGLSSPWLPPNTARAMRILYSSTDGLVAGHRVAVSGYVLFPKGPMPKGGWRLISWAHGTTGFADACAPSRMGPAPRDRAYLGAWLEKGFAIVATDYQGLGTPGPHPYLLYQPEAYSVLDATRAVIADTSLNIRNEVVLVGQSQGAGAALATAWEYPRYAPDLHIAGAVLTGLVTAIGDAQRLHQTSVSSHYTTISDMDPSFAMLRLAGSDQALEPSTDLTPYLTEKGMAMYRTAQSGCLHDLFKTAKQIDVKKGKELLKTGLPASDDEFDGHFTLPDAHVTIPLFVGTGLADNMAGTNGQYEAVKQLCAAGTSVTWHTYPGLTHSGTVNYALRDSLPFVETILAGKPASSTCGTVTAPGPIQTPLPGIAFNE
ncbi:lipase family protein [Gluconobacter wancherniae]|uniref:lipase family protein n=1 Tax=Gluconobacter wancherniae TaxID=1307955 RepID=UPI001B8C155C|nr:lipase family protein [Gluconobacter wancherniae]MBS1089918.1 lipase [Gluconobacter wancherniae]